VVASSGNFMHGSTYYRGGSGASLTPPTTNTTNGTVVEPTKLDCQVGKLVSWMRTNMLEPVEMDYLALTVMGKAFIDFNPEDLSQFIEALRTLETRNGKKSRLAWSQMTDQASASTLYHKYKTRLQFPYFMTEYNQLLKIRDEFLKEVHDNKENQKAADTTGEV
jgi:hypothetical protein